MTGFFKEIPPYYEHQEKTLSLLRSSDVVLDLSDPGTGKTRPAIAAFVERRRNGGGKCLVLAPKSILQPAWGNDIDKFFPGVSYMCAYAKNRKIAFEQDVDIYITNHDAVKWIIRDNNLPKGYFDAFDTLIVDESTAYKNPNSQRSKAIRKLSTRFKYRQCLTGTPNPNSITEVWHQALILDEGAALGTSFWKFRGCVCEPVQVGPGINHIQWRDKEGAELSVYDLLDHMLIRHRYEDCHDSDFGEPYKVYYDLPAKVRAKYKDMEEIAATMLEDGKVLTAVHAASTHQKLMQIASGAVYTDHENNYSVVDEGRTELVMDLIDARDQCVVGFIWRHQRESLEKAAQKRKISYAFIDGTVNDAKRRKAVEDFQAGKIKVIFAHPQSAGHGLTLTAGTTTIWASPTYNPEQFKQLNARINRAGQDKRTETILVTARDTIDERVYEKLDGKLDSMQLFLELTEAA